MKLTKGFKNSSKHPLYKVWSSMMYRCHNENSTLYRTYGAKGIKVCKRWHDFKNFIQDMGLKPSKEYSIDRIDGKLGYSPENCRWATPEIQKSNIRKPEPIKPIISVGKRVRFIAKTPKEKRTFDGRLVSGMTYGRIESIDGEIVTVNYQIRRGITIVCNANLLRN